MLGKQAEDVELLGRQVDLEASDGDTSAGDVDSHRSRLHHRVRDAGVRGTIAPQMCLDARDELQRAERLGDVVIGAHAQPDGLVDVGIASGEHDDRDVGPLAKAPGEFETVGVRQHHVEHGEHARSVRERRERGGGGGARGHDVVALRLEVELHHLEDGRVVVDGEDAALHAVPPSGTAPW